MRIGLQVPGIRDYFSLSIWRYANEILRDSDNQLILLPVDCPNPRNSSVFRMSLYNFISSSNLDGMILSGSSFLNTLKRSEWDNFLKPFIHDVPTVSIGKTYEGIPMVCTSAYNGINQAVDHLVKCHNVSRIAFQKGCEGNPEAIERFECFIKAMERHNLPVVDEWIFPGEFIERSGVELADKLLESSEPIPFEAILVSNDTMAGALLDRLDSHNVKIPEELKIIGFDDIPFSLNYAKPLATIRQPFKEQVDRALDRLFALIKGEEVADNAALETEFVVRASCGCSRNDSEKIKELLGHDSLENMSLPNKVTPYYDELCNLLLAKEHSDENMDTFLKLLERAVEKDFRENIFFNWSINIAYLFNICRDQNPESFSFYENRGLFHLAQFIVGDKHLFEKNREVNHFKKSTTVPLQRMVSDLHSSRTKDEVFRTLENHLIKLDIKTSFVFLFDEINDEDFIHTPYGDIPPVSRMFLNYQEGRSLRINQKENCYPSLSLLSGQVVMVEDCNFLVNPLYMQEMFFGFIFLGLQNEIDSSVYEGIRLGLSSCLRNLALMEKLENANKQMGSLLDSMKDFNTRLLVQSNHDSMTSLLNRRGFIDKVKKRMDTCSIQNVPYTIFFADMDGLKKINDTHGHSSGDEAIQTMADILKKVFRHDDLIARFGGDEFAVFSERVPEDIIHIVRSRLESAMNEYNSSSDKPYSLNISIGSCGIQSNSLETLDNLLHNADMSLYKQKKLRKRKITL